jgi:hypothetical protein
VGLYPLDAALGLLPGRLHRDGQKATAKLVPAVPDDEAQQLFGDWTGIGLGSERLHTFTKHVVEGLTVLDVAAITRRDRATRR